MIGRFAAAGLLLRFLAAGQTPSETKPSSSAAQSSSELATALTRRLSDELQVKTAVGKPVVVGSVTLIPILMIDVSFGGAALPASRDAKAGTPQGPAVAGDVFLMSGEARPLGFVAITSKGTTFISVAKGARPGRTP